MSRRILFLLVAAALCCAAERGARADEVAATAVDFEAILRQPVKVEFTETPLSDVVDFFSDHLDINIQLDAKGLTDAAVDSSAPVTLSLRKPISFASTLRLILDNFDLTFVVQDEVLKITSKEKADEILTTKVYEVGDLLGRKPHRSSFGMNWQRQDQLVAVLESHVQPDSWDGNGGPGSIMQIDTSVVITQNRVAHQEIAQILADLRAKLPKATANAKGADELMTFAYYIGHADGEDTAVAIKNGIEPSAWTGQGGKGSVSVVRKTQTQVANGTETSRVTFMLVIRQTEALHERVRELLEEIGVPGPGWLGGMGGQGSP